MHRYPQPWFISPIVPRLKSRFFSKAEESLPALAHASLSNYLSLSPAPSAWFQPTVLWGIAQTKLWASWGTLYVDSLCLECPLPLPRAGSSLSFSPQLLRGLPDPAIRSGSFLYSLFHNNTIRSDFMDVFMVFCPASRRTDLKLHAGRDPLASLSAKCPVCGRQPCTACLSVDRVNVSLAMGSQG